MRAVPTLLFVVLIAVVQGASRRVPDHPPVLPDPATLPVIPAQHRTFKDEPPRQFLYAYVTYVTKTSDVDSANILAQSLRNSGTKEDLVAIVSPLIDGEHPQLLRKAGWKLIDVGEVPNPFREKCAQIEGKTPRECFEFTLLRLWNLPYKKVIFISSSMKVQTNIDDLFRLASPLAATLANCASPLQTQQDQDQTQQPQFGTDMLVLTPSLSVAEEFSERLAAIDPPTTQPFSVATFLNQVFKKDAGDEASAWHMLQREENCAKTCFDYNRNLTLNVEKCRVVYSAATCLEKK